MLGQVSPSDPAGRSRRTIQSRAFTALENLAVDVKYVEATRASRFPGRCLDVGVVMDLMIHDLDLVLSMTDAAIKSVSASGLAVISNHEDLAEARIEFECGMVANLKASRVSPAPARQMQVFRQQRLRQHRFRARGAVDRAAMRHGRHPFV